MPHHASRLPSPLLSRIRSWQRTRDVDVVIIGAGIAGLATALRLPDHLRIAVITKGVLGESNTRYAQGGFAAPIGPDDDVELHITDTLEAGAGLSDPAPVRNLIEHAADAVAWLIAKGTTFDRDGDDLALGREAAHSRNRILHAGGDATGAEIERALVSSLRARPGISILERTTAIDLVVDDDGRCQGVIILAEGETEREYIAATETILANGGAGQLWSVTSNPEGATGDGMAMALRAGVVLADLEFAQFHPTVLIIPGSEGFLISEAVRGEGAYLRSSSGKRFMLDIDPRAELAPRDVVARGIQQQMAIDEMPFVLLDVRHLDPDFVRQRFPTISAHLERLGLDLTQNVIPVAPAAHYFMGGIAAGTDGRTSMPGLRAIGEVSCTGVQGANRLASNSLLEGLVFGLETADAIASSTSVIANPVLSENDEGMQAMTLQDNNRTVGNLRYQIQDIMGAYVAVVRSAESLRIAAQGLQELASEVEKLAIDTGSSVELRNMIALASQVVASATWRQESRGGHYRSDYPEQDPNLDGMHQRVQLMASGISRTFGTINDVLALPTLA